MLATFYKQLQEVPVESQIDMSVLVANNFVDYGRAVNLQRAIPSEYDGLKPIHRRLLIVGLGMNHSKMVKSADMIGNCISNHHPHGDKSIYETLVKMVVSPVPVFEKQGNFGRVGIISQGPAAMRYTEVRVNNTGRALFGKFVSDAPKTQNSIPKVEAAYLPTLIPYSLLNGVSGVGLGLRTSHPMVSLEELVKFIRKYLKDGSINPVKPSISAGNLIISDSEVMRLHETGICRYVLAPNLTRGEFKGLDSTLITDLPPRVAPHKLLEEFSKEIDERLVIIRDARMDNKRVVVVSRNKNVRKVSNDEIFERCSKVMRVTVSVDTVIAGKIVRRVSPARWMSQCVDRYHSFYRGRIQSELDELASEAKFYQIREKFLDCLLKDYSIADTCRICEINDKQYDKWAARSLSSLRKIGNLDSINSSIESASQRLIVSKDGLIKSLKELKV